MVPFTDLSRGAGQHGLRNQKILIASDILDDYQEIDPSLGYNAAGIILSVLKRHLAVLPAVEQSDSFAACLRRRADGRKVELSLSVSRSRWRGEECLKLHRGEDREME